VEASLVYAEPGMTGTVELIDGHWVLKDDAGNEYVLGDDIPLPPDVVYPGAFLDESSVDNLSDAILRPDNVEASLVYAEPGMTGTVELIDGHWFLTDEDGVEYVIASSPPPEAGTGNFPDPRFMDRVEASLVYAEPGMTGTIALIDGHWFLTDEDGVEYVIASSPPPEAGTGNFPGPRFRDRVEASLVYAEPGMTGTIALIDGYWILTDEDGVEYVIASSPPPEAGTGNFPDPRFRDRVDSSLVYAEPGDLPHDLTGEPQFIDDTEGEVILRKIYDTIVRLETAPDRPPEIIMDIGPVHKENDNSGDKVSLMLIKNLESGKYYLQIGLFDRKEVLARKLTSLNWAYPYALETTENLKSPKYKLLVGPVNEGESNALLLRFKRYGYHDAFIRRDG
jgi:hypothetical protein